MGLLQNTQKPSAIATTKLTPLTDTEEIPVPLYQFAILMDGEIMAFFQSVGGMQIKRDVEGLKEGGKNEATHEFPGQVSYEHVTFEVGLTSSDFFWKWMMDGVYEGWVQKKTFDLIQRRTNPNYKGTAGEEIWEVVKTWNFINAFPVNWKLSDLSLDDSKTIAVETLELSFDYFTLAPNTYKPPPP